MTTAKDQVAICEQVNHCMACFGGRVRGEPFNHIYHHRADQAWPDGCVCAQYFERPDGANGTNRW